MTLKDKLNQDGDAAYATLMAAHEGLSLEDSHRLNARLILILMNEIGDADRFSELISAASAKSSAY